MNDGPENLKPEPNIEGQKQPEVDKGQETPETLTARGEKELNEFINESDRGMLMVESVGQKAGLTSDEVVKELERVQVPQQVAELKRLSRGFFARMARKIETAAAIGLATAVLSQAPTAEAGPGPVISKTNPQREGYKDYDSYKRYIEAMRDLKGEVESAKVQEEWRSKFDRYQKEAEANRKDRADYLKLIDEYKKKGWLELAVKYEELVRSVEEGEKTWLELAKGAKEMELKVLERDPKKNYEIAKSLTEEEFQKKSEIAAKAFEKADEHRAWMAGIVHSDSYGSKAKEYENLTDEEIKRRQQNVLENDVRIADPYHKLPNDSLGAHIRDDKKTRDAGQYIVSPVEQAEGHPSTIHELEHAVTDQEEHMSVYAKRLYARSYAGPDTSTPDGKYFSRPTEMDARKRVFEYELERNGIWKYGETFTEEHLQKAIDLDIKGKLSAGATEFLLFTKPENIPVIMNTIAREIAPDGRESSQSA